MAQWRWISGYEGAYQVSDDGRVRSVDRIEKVGNSQRLRKGKELVVMTKHTGYQCVNLYKQSQMKTCLVHRLVANAFIPCSDSKTEVNHKDGDKSNNRVENLEWVTPSENVQHAFSVLNKKPTRYGSLSVEAIRDIRASTDFHWQIAKRHGVSRSLIGQIKQGKIYKGVL